MDSRSPSSSARPSAVSVLMSYQARIRMPMLSVTGRTRACGNTKRTPGESGSFSSGTIGTKSWPSAPRPCSQMTLAEAGVAGARTTASADSCIRWVIASAVLVFPVELLALGEPLDGRREAPFARRLLLRAGEPLDVLALLRRRESLECLPALSHFSGVRRRDTAAASPAASFSAPASAGRPLRSVRPQP